MSFSVKTVAVSVKYAVPYFVMAVLFALDSVYIAWAAIGDIRPGFVLMAIYYWAIYRPSLFPPVLIFLLALAMDVTNGTALGLHCLIYLPLFLFIRAQRRILYEQPFFVVWIAFIACSIAVNALTWLLVRISAYNFDMHIDSNVVLGLTYDITSSVFLYPIISMTLFFIHRMLPYKMMLSGDKA